MSVYKRPGAETYSYDFRLKGHRYSGDTGKSTKREAERQEDTIRQQAKAAVKREGEPMTMGEAVGRYWTEIGQHHKNHDTTLVTFAWLEREIGKSKILSAISNDDMTKLVAKRRAQGVSPATVNRSVTQPMRALLTRAEKKWGQRVQQIDWTDHMLKEPEERVRELLPAEETKLFVALRPDYHAIVRFALMSGCRMQECLDLTWRRIDWHNREIRVTGKGDKTRTIPITRALYALLRSVQKECGEVPSADDAVFTYLVKRADHAPRGTRLPIEREGLKITFRRAVDKAEIADFSFHDLRHTCATRLLRKNGNLRLVRELLGHSDINTTLKYAHVTKADLLAAMEEDEQPENGRGNSRGNL